MLRFEGFLAAGALWVSASSYEIGSSGEVEGGGRVFAPAGDLLSFASPKESKQRKGDPTVCVPALRSGQPAVLAASGVSLELASLRQSRALIRWPLRSSAHSEGMGEPNSHSGLCCARPWGRQLAFNVPWAFSTHIVRLATKSFWLNEQLSSEKSALDSSRSSKFSSTSL